MSRVYIRYLLHQPDKYEQYELVVVLDPFLSFQDVMDQRDDAITSIYDQETTIGELGLCN